MLSDVSFLLATCRSPEKFAHRVIESIWQTKSFNLSCEILVVGTEKITGRNLKWIEDPAPGTGSVHAYNLAYKHSAGTYIIPIVDDALLHPNVLELVQILKSDFFQHKRYKVVCMESAVNPGICVVRYNDFTFPVACFPVLTRETIENELNGWLLNPQFTHGFADNWLGWWLGVNGEPAIWLANYRLRELADVTYNVDSQQNQDTLWRLIKEHQIGERKVYAP